MESEVLYLIDGTSICYRSFFAIRLSTTKGFPTGAIYGFFTTLRKIIKKYNPLYLGVCFDVSRKTFRQDKFREYKIQRPSIPHELKVQFPLIKKLLSLWGIKLVEKEGFEADDIIASLTQKALREDFKVVIVSSDKDIYQLIDDGRVCIYDPVKNRMYEENTFNEEYGFIPSLMVDYLALTGDTTDNVPGAKGIGKVGATKLVKLYGSVENIFKNLDNIPSKMRCILVNNKDNIFLSKELLILSSPNIDITLDDLKRREANYQDIYGMFRELEFSSLLKDIPLPSVNLGIKIENKLPWELKEEINSERRIIFYPWQDKVFILGKHETVTYETSIEDIQEFFRDHNLDKVSYDFKEIYKNFKTHWLDERSYFDIKVASYLVNPSLGDYSMENLIGYFLNIFTKEIPPQTYPYFINKLYLYLKEKMKDLTLESLFVNVEMPLVRVISAMESWGINIDQDYLIALSKEVDNRISTLTEEIFKISGGSFNINSPQQLRKVLFEQLKIPPVKRTKTGFSTDEEVLEKLAHNYPIAKLLLEYRELSKLKSTYISPFLEEVKIKGGRIYAKFNQMGTQTGRLSSYSPNLQSVPAKGDFAQKIRKAFVPSFKEGFILSADYSQIELRILAHLSKEDNLIDAFKRGEDIHSFTARLLFDIPSQIIDKEQRDIAKRVNFGIVYGMSAYGLAKELEVGEEEARAFIENYFLRYPKVRDFIERSYEEVKKTGYTKTLMGRIRYVEEINSPNPELRDFALRQAVNTPIQGTAADLIKLAMVKIFREFNKNNLNSKLIIQIHDELVFDVLDKELDKVISIVKECMEGGLELVVPVLVNIKIGKNWLELQPIV
ncbi:MAG: DNA polymerase I [Candidatus Omnitrophica bacterium]|nr:DNA polymerase I [Candidatus Omnitrophota bacterium]